MEGKKEEKKLSYEQLQNYAAQMSDQANKLFKENQSLKQKLVDNTRAFGLEELKCALRCIELKESFSEEFIKKVVMRVEEILDPDAKPDEKQVENGESKSE